MLSSKRAELEKIGVFVGERDPKRNTAFKGRFMVAESLDVGQTQDASEGGFCIVGDNINQLIADAYNTFFG